MTRPSIHRVRVEDRGESLAEQEQKTRTHCNKCGGRGWFTDDSYGASACPFCEAGERKQVEMNPITAEFTVTESDS